MTPEHGAHRDPETPQPYTPSRLSPRHREILACLANNGGSAQLVELARAVAAYRQGLPPEFVTAETTQQTYTELHRLVTEELTTRELVEYCEHEGVVELSE